MQTIARQMTANEVKVLMIKSASTPNMQHEVEQEAAKTASSSTTTASPRARSSTSPSTTRWRGAGQDLTSARRWRTKREVRRDRRSTDPKAGLRRRGPAKTPGWTKVGEQTRQLGRPSRRRCRWNLRARTPDIQATIVNDTMAGAVDHRPGRSASTAGHGLRQDARRESEHISSTVTSASRSTSIDRGGRPAR